MHDPFGSSSPFRHIRGKCYTVGEGCICMPQAVITAAQDVLTQCNADDAYAAACMPCVLTSHGASSCKAGRPARHTRRVSLRSLDKHVYEAWHLSPVAQQVWPGMAMRLAATRSLQNGAAPGSRRLHQMPHNPMRSNTDMSEGSRKQPPDNARVRTHTPCDAQP
jgi:hypothetical protein